MLYKLVTLRWTANTMLDIKDLRLIQALYDHKTLTRAARALNQKQPALSRQLLTLESKIGGA